MREKDDCIFGAEEGGVGRDRRHLCVCCDRKRTGPGQEWGKERRRPTLGTLRWYHARRARRRRKQFVNSDMVGEIVIVIGNVFVEALNYWHDDFVFTINITIYALQRVGRISIYTKKQKVKILIDNFAVLSSFLSIFYPLYPIWYFNHFSILYPNRNRYPRSTSYFYIIPFTYPLSFFPVVLLSTLESHTTTHFFNFKLRFSIHLFHYPSLGSWAIIS